MRSRRIEPARALDTAISLGNFVRRCSSPGAHRPVPDGRGARPRTPAARPASRSPPIATAPRSLLGLAQKVPESVETVPIDVLVTVQVSPEVLWADPVPPYWA